MRQFTRAGPRWLLPPTRWGLQGFCWTVGLLVVVLVVTVAAQSRDEGARQERRVALVIGNGDYEQGRLHNPVNDARAIAQALRRAGFEVIAKENADRGAMYEAINAFGDRLKETNGVGLFYFSGHGLQVQGKNFMMPLRARITSERMVETEAVDVNRVLGEMDAAQARVNIVVLDACRHNPYARSFRSISRGLAQIDAPRGTLIAYATAPGKVAEDGTGQNSPYTAALVKHLAEPGLPIETVFKRVRVDVLNQTGNRQEPWEASSLTGDFFFFPGGVVAAIPPGVTTANIEGSFETKELYEVGWAFGRLQPPGVGRNGYQEIEIDPTTGANGTRRSLRMRFLFGDVIPGVGPVRSVTQNTLRRDLTRFDGATFFLKSDPPVRVRFHLWVGSLSAEAAEHWVNDLPVSGNWREYRVRWQNLAVDGRSRFTPPKLDLQAVAGVGFSLLQQQNLGLTAGTLWVDEISFFSDRDAGTR